ncbi:HNH endonuclease [Fodinibius sp. AD559]|uniref:HNH endonuclease n=1 Tax=Fodinibius sp. AD559 TaxID=3424179 RepID=UPI004046C05F
MITEREISSILNERFGIDVSVSFESFYGNRKIIITPSDIERTIGFKIVSELRWRSIKIDFLPGPYGKELVKQMESANEDQRAAFRVFADSLSEKNVNLTFQVNGQAFAPDDPTNWPEDWESIQISMRKVGLVLGQDSDKDIEKVLPWVISFFGLCISLLPLEPIEEENKHEFTMEEEGTPYSVKMTRYERSSLNRAACIEIHGVSCKVCSMDFEEYYGQIGEGYIHVHHKIPLSEIDDSYTINPKKDLVPVCPNCHAMLHKKTPPLTVKELKKKLTTN